MKQLTLIFILCLSSSLTKAEVYESHIVPLKKGFDNTGLMIIGSGLLAVALAQPHDFEVRDSFNNYQRINHSAARAGDFLGTGIPGVAIALTQLYFDHDAGIAHTEALLATFVATTTLKYGNQRNRPNSDNRLSMPSGHTSTTFATATSLTYVYGWKAAIPAYTLATFTAATRWTDDAHWFSDTIAGAFIGIFWGRATALHHLSPIVSSEAVGFNFNTSF